MKRIGVVVGIVLFASLAIAAPSFFAFQPDSSVTVLQRAKRMIYTETVPKHYNYIKRLNLTTDSTWVCPDSVWITAVYCSRATNIRMQLRGGDSTTVPLDSLAGLPVDVKRIWKRGTDSLSWVGKIYLFGVINRATE